MQDVRAIIAIWWMEVTEPVQVYLIGRWRPWRQKHQRFRQGWDFCYSPYSVGTVIDVQFSCFLRCRTWAPSQINLLPRTARSYGGSHECWELHRLTEAYLNLVSYFFRRIRPCFVSLQTWIVSRLDKCFVGCSFLERSYCHARLMPSVVHMCPKKLTLLLESKLSLSI